MEDLPALRNEFRRVQVFAKHYPGYSGPREQRHDLCVGLSSLADAARGCHPDRTPIRGYTTCKHAPLGWLRSPVSDAQLPRRKALAQARNYLLSRALDDEDYVLWIDVDVVSYPPNVLQTLLATNKCVLFGVAKKLVTLSEVRAMHPHP